MPTIDQDDSRVEDVYNFLMGYLSETYSIQKFPKPDLVYHALRIERNNELKRALWKLFELESW